MDAPLVVTPCQFFFFLNFSFHKNKWNRVCCFPGEEGEGQTEGGGGWLFSAGKQAFLLTFYNLYVYHKNTLSLFAVLKNLDRSIISAVCSLNWLCRKSRLEATTNSYYRLRFLLLPKFSIQNQHWCTVINAFEFTFRGFPVWPAHSSTVATTVATGLLNACQTRCYYLCGFTMFYHRKLGQNWPFCIRPSKMRTSTPYRTQFKPKQMPCVHQIRVDVHINKIPHWIRFRYIKQKCF